MVTPAEILRCGGTQNIQWFVENFAAGEAKPEQMLESLAAQIAPGADGLLCLPYWSGAMTPYWDGHARGAFVGLSGLHGKAHMYRAVLEGMALEQRFLTEGAEAATGQKIDDLLILGGGSRSPLWCQIIADAMGRPVKLVREQESTALGAGIHPAAAIGLHADIRTAADAMTGIHKTYVPDEAMHERYTRMFEVYRGLYPSLSSTFQLIAKNMR